MTNIELQQHLLEAVRQEFGHNLSQQIYVSDELWTTIIAARESLVKLINISSSKVKADGNATELGEIIIKLYAQSDQAPTEAAKRFLKEEIKEIF